MLMHSCCCSLYFVLLEFAQSSKRFKYLLKMLLENEKEKITSLSLPPLAFGSSGPAPSPLSLSPFSLLAQLPLGPFSPAWTNSPAAPRSPPQAAASFLLLGHPLPLLPRAA